jgi:hypothetical protein
VRPTDENQHGSTRPNLMSSGTRRAGNEDNILAMLDRNERGRRGGPPRLAVYGAAGVVVMLLITVLAWLVQENMSSTATLRVVEQAAVVRVPDPPGSEPAAGASTGPQSEPGPALAATIVDNPDSQPAVTARTPAVAAAAAITTAQAAGPELPALVLLSAAPPSSTSNSKAERAGAARLQPVREPEASPPGQPSALARLAARPRPAAISPAPRAPTRAAQAKGKKSRAGAAEQAVEAQADTDVALISAIISQSSRHAHERQAGKTSQACGDDDKKCGPRAGSPP